MHARPMTCLFAVAAVLAACGADHDASDTTSPPTSPTVSAASASTASTSTTLAPTTTTVGSTTTSESASVPPVAPVALWPGAGTVFATPEEAAADFVTTALGVPAALGPFRQGDARSGEIDVLLPPEGTTADLPPRSVLLLRRLGPDEGWFVMAAVHDVVTITSPQAGATVPAGPLAVQGTARGFEATVVAEAFLAGSHQLLDQVVFMAGNFDAAAPYEVTLDLSAAAPGDAVVVLVRGTVGLETDSGEFSALAVVIGPHQG